MNRASHPNISRALGALRLSTRSTSQVPEEVNVLPPFRIHRTSTSVLEAIASTIRRPPGYHPDILPNDPLFFKDTRSSRLFNHTLEYKLKGRQSARFIIDNRIAGDIVPLREEQPRIPAFDPRITASQVAEMPPSEETLIRLIALGNASSAWEMYNNLGAETVSSETRLRLLDLFCAHNSRSRHLLETDQLEIFIDKHQSSFSIPTRPIQKQAYPSWASDGFAEQLFKTLSDKEKGPGYRAMIRGMVRHGAYEQALLLHREMVEAGHSGDLKSYNAVLMCVHVVEPFSWKRGKERMAFHPWRAGLDLFYEMRDSGIAPDVESFNSLIFSVAFSYKVMKTKAISASKSIAALLKEMEALDIPPNLGTLTNILRFADHVADSSKIKSESAMEGSPVRLLEDKFEVKSLMSEILDYVVAEMSKDKGRKRFGTEFDTEILLLVNNAKFCHTNPTDFVLRLHYLLRDSPGLAVRQIRRTHYISDLLTYLSSRDPSSAVDIIEEEMNYVGLTRTPEKLKYIDAFAIARPERMPAFLKTLVHQTNVHEDFISLRILFIALSHVADSHPTCRPAVLQALTALWTRVHRDWQAMEVLTDQFFSNFFFLLLPADVSSEVEVSALDLGVSIVSALKRNDLLFSSSHRILHLAHALLKAGRSREGLSVLEALVAKKRSVFEKDKNQFDSLVNELSEMPEVMENEDLSEQLKRHKMAKHLYVISNKNEVIIDKNFIKKELKEKAAHSSRRKTDSRTDSRKPGRSKMSGRKPADWDGPEGKANVYRPRREFDEKAKHDAKQFFGFPRNEPLRNRSKFKHNEKHRDRKRTEASQSLPELKPGIPVSELESEENWPSPEENSKNSDSSDDESSSSSSSSSSSEEE